MTREAPAHVYLIDDDRSVLRAIGRLLRLDGYNVAECESPEAFLHNLPDNRSPGCIVLDYAFPDRTGLDVQRDLRRRGIILPIVFLTAHGEVPLAVKAMRDGAVDFLSKECDPSDLLAAVRSAISTYLQRSESDREVLEFACRLQMLTPREREVMELVVAGNLNKQIANQLGLVEQTIKVHRAHVMSKLNVDSVAELAKLHVLFRKFGGAGSASRHATGQSEQTGGARYTKV